MNVKKQFGINLKRFRKAAKLSQEELAEKVNVSAKHIGALESGVSFVSAELLENFSKIFCVPVSLFFIDNDEPDYKLEFASKVPIDQINSIIASKLNRTSIELMNDIRHAINTSLASFNEKL